MERTVPAGKRLKFHKIENEKKAYDTANELMLGNPVCVDFNDCPDKIGEMLLHFLQGVNYATDGNCIKLKNKVFLFATKKDLKDPGLERFISDYKEV